MAVYGYVGLCRAMASRAVYGYIGLCRLCMGM